MESLIFVDEAGDLGFDASSNQSRYFMICSVIAPSDVMATGVLSLRRHLIWNGIRPRDNFHASHDDWTVRHAVFERISSFSFSFACTVVEKSRVHAKMANDHTRIYSHCFFRHFQSLVEAGKLNGVRAHITSASLGTGRLKRSFEVAVEDALSRAGIETEWRLDIMPAAHHPSLQIADYCAWAVQRKWERSDERFYSLIKDKIAFENMAFESSDGV